jgi:NitT/TauT family transport system ATP-binding protein
MPRFDASGTADSMTAPVPTAAEPLLELRNVTKSYGRPKTFVAVERVSLQIREGEFVCLLGPSGCGKSTLLRIITGLNTATSGEVNYRGQPLVGVNPHATIVFQTFALYPWLTVQQNVELAMKALGTPAAERARRAGQLLDTVGLDGFESAYPRELSGGMKQKVGFARAMAAEPELLCLDEPFSALDVLSAEALRGELLELWTSHAIPTKAILMVTHNIEEAVLLADRILVMDKEPGRLIAQVEVVLRQPRHRKDAAFQGLVDKVYSEVAGETAAAAAPGDQPIRPGQHLPVPRLNALAGLLERLREEDDGRADLHELGNELQLELDDLLPVIEAAEILGFARVEEGDLLILPTGGAFADASILARKEIIAGRILRHPTIRWIYETLQADDDGRVVESFFLDRLKDEFGVDAPKELESAIAWGRHAELFAFDDNSDEVFLEG